VGQICAGGRLAGGGRFELAREALGIACAQDRRSVYELDGRELGHFDSHSGSLLWHLLAPACWRLNGSETSRASWLLVEGLTSADRTVTPRSGRSADEQGRQWWWEPIWRDCPYSGKPTARCI